MYSYYSHSHNILFSRFEFLFNISIHLACYSDFDVFTQDQGDIPLLPDGNVKIALTYISVARNQEDIQDWLPTVLEL